MIEDKDKANKKAKAAIAMLKDVASYLCAQDKLEGTQMAELVGFIDSIRKNVLDV